MPAMSLPFVKYEINSDIHNSVMVYFCLMAVPHVLEQFDHVLQADHIPSREGHSLISQALYSTARPGHLQIHIIAIDYIHWENVGID